MAVEQAKKRGAPQKATKLTSRVAFRASDDLAAWLEQEGARKGLDVGSFARMLLMNEMHKQGTCQEEKHIKNHDEAKRHGKTTGTSGK